MKTIKMTKNGVTKIVDERLKSEYVKAGWSEVKQPTYPFDTKK